MIYTFNSFEIFSRSKAVAAGTYPGMVPAEHKHTLPPTLKKGNNISLNHFYHIRKLCHQFGIFLCSLDVEI